MANTGLLLFVAFSIAFTAAAAEQVILASQVGAVPDDGKDDAAALQAAIDNFKGAKNVRLVFDKKGRYDFFVAEVPRPPHNALSFKDVAGLTLDGSDSELIFHGLVGGLSFYNCSNVKVTDLTLDWDPPSFSLGEITAAAPLSFDVKVWNEFPVKGGEPVEAFMNYDPAAKIPFRRCIDAYDAVKETTLVAPQLLRVHLKRRIPMTVGHLVVLRHKVYGFNGLDFNNCLNVAVQDVAIFTAPGMGIHDSFTRDIAVSKLTVKPRPDTSRIMSTTADATHFNCCYGKLVIEDSFFEAMGDDAVNVHGMYHIIDQVVNENTVITHCRNNWVLPPRPADVFELCHTDTLIPYWQGAVDKVTIDNAKKQHVITFKEKLPKEAAVGDALGNASWAPETRISRCTVRCNRARGFLIQTRNALIEGNDFTNTTHAALHVTCDLDYWLESIGTRSVIIRNNKFKGCNYWAASRGVISVFADVKGRNRPPAGVHKDLTIERNIFRHTPNSAIYLSSTDGALVRANVTEFVCQNPTSQAAEAAVYIEEARNVRVIDNTFIGVTEPDDQVRLGGGCDAATIEVTGNRGLLQGSTREAE